MTPPTSVIDCSLYYRMASGTGAVQDQKASQELLPPSHKTLEQVIKWLPGLSALCPANPSFTLLLLSVIILHSDFNNFTYMYILPQLPRLTGEVAH